MSERCETCPRCFSGNPNWYGVECRFSANAFHDGQKSEISAPDTPDQKSVTSDTPASEPTPSEDDLTGVERVEMGLAEAMIATRVADAVREETERCAKVCDVRAAFHEREENALAAQELRDTAAAIRAGGEG